LRAPDFESGASAIPPLRLHIALALQPLIYQDITAQYVIEHVANTFRRNCKGLQRNCKGANMASLMQQGDRFYCQFVYFGNRHCFSPGKVPRNEAEAKMSQADYLLMRLKQGFLHTPPGMDIIAFLEFDGKPPVQPVAMRDAPTLGLLRDDT
jgi:hypothetical protein